MGRGQQHRIRATTLGDLFLRACDRYPDHEAVVFPHARLTYAELCDGAYRRARSLLGAGLERGDHVGILMPNRLEYIECLLGIALMGGMAVLVNARYKGSELAYVIENADLDALLVADAGPEEPRLTTLLATTYPELARECEAVALSISAAPRLRFIAEVVSHRPDRR